MVLAEMLSHGSGGLGHGALVMAKHLGNVTLFQLFPIRRAPILHQMRLLAAIELISPTVHRPDVARKRNFP